MCCIFTCCGWMIDLLQRLWTFTMSCCISSAVCCALLTVSISGIALGYNYSLAEYIDLKETNVSVYMKRGVFDDEVSEDMDWRRSGHMPVAGHIGEDKLMTGARDDEDSTTPGSGRRRLEQSIYESDDHNKFEGSLMRLTAKDLSSTADSMTAYTKVMEVMTEYPKGSLDQLKAIQSVINNMQKSAQSEANRRAYNSGRELNTPSNVIDERYLPPFPYLGYGGRRVGIEDPDVGATPSNSLRLAVPGQSINEQAKWYRPKLPLNSLNMNAIDGPIDMSPTYPSPVTPRAGPVRPTRPRSTGRPTPRRTQGITTTTSSTTTRDEFGRGFDDDIDAFKENLMFDKPRFKSDDLDHRRKGKGHGRMPDDDEYENMLKHSYLNVRKKRKIAVLPNQNRNFTVTNTNLTSSSSSSNSKENSTRISIDLNTPTIMEISHESKGNNFNNNNSNVLIVKLFSFVKEASRRS